MVLPLLCASATDKRGAERGRNLGRRFSGEHRRKRSGRARADRPDIETENCRRQAARHWSARRSARRRRYRDRASARSARHEQIAQAVALAALWRARSDRRKSRGMRASSFAAFTAVSAAMVCISVSPVPPDFDTQTKRVVASGSLLRNSLEGARIEIVHEMDARRGAQRADARAPHSRQAAPGSARQGSIRRCRE